MHGSVELQRLTALQACFDTYRRHNSAHPAVCVYCRAAWGSAASGARSGSTASTGREGYVNLATLQPGTEEGREPWIADGHFNHRGRGGSSYARRGWH